MHVTIDFSTRSDTPLDPKGGRLTNHDLAVELLTPLSRDIAVLVRESNYVVAMRALDYSLRETELTTDKRAQMQAALEAIRAATLDALAAID